MYKIQESSINISIFLECILNDIPNIEITSERIIEKSVDLVRSAITRALIGSERGWVKNVMNEKKAIQIFNEFISFFQTVTKIFTNTLESSWIPFYKS